MEEELAIMRGTGLLLFPSLLCWQMRLALWGGDFLEESAKGV